MKAKPGGAARAAMCAANTSAQARQFAWRTILRRMKGYSKRARRRCAA
jgi:hypothetical protein